jgi:hypothetical protein
MTSAIDAGPMDAAHRNRYSSTAFSQIRGLKLTTFLNLHIIDSVDAHTSKMTMAGH